MHTQLMHSTQRNQNNRRKTALGGRGTTLILTLIFAAFCYVLANMVVDYYTVLNLRSEPVDDLTRGFRRGSWRKQEDADQSEKHLDDLFIPQEMARVPCFADFIKLQNDLVNLTRVIGSNYSSQCANVSPKYKIGFVKTHKCASDTLAGMFMRVADEQNLEVILPRKTGAWNLGWPRYPRLSLYLPSLKKSKLYDMQVLHHLFVPKVWNSLLEPGYKLLGVIRNPFDHFTSIFNYFAVSVRIAREFNISNNTAFDYFLKHPNVYFKYFAHDDGNFIFKNPLLFDFGYTVDSEIPLQRFMTYVRRRFAVVLVADHMDESLVLLKRTLCWTMRDILIISKNKSRWKNLADPSTMPKGDKKYQEREALYKKWSKEDIVFYDTFRQILQNRIAKEPFFQEELQVYRRVREITRRYCNRSVGLNKPVRIKASVFNEQFTIDKYLCNRLRLPVLNYILKLQNKHNHTLQVQQGIINSKFQWSDDSRDAMGEFIKPDKKINLIKVSGKGQKYQLTKEQQLTKRSISQAEENDEH